MEREFNVVKVIAELLVKIIVPKQSEDWRVYVVPDWLLVLLVLVEHPLDPLDRSLQAACAIAPVPAPFNAPVGSELVPVPPFGIGTGGAWARSKSEAEVSKIFFIANTIGSPLRLRNPKPLRQRRHSARRSTLVGAY